MKKMIHAALAAVCLSGLSACGRGGGIGLQSMLADYNCEQAGYQLGTPDYRACRGQIARQEAATNETLMAHYARQQELITQQVAPLPRPQSCTYTSTTFGRNTSGLINC